MRIFLDEVPLGDVPGPVHRLGELFPRLVGVRLSSAGNGKVRWLDIAPIYMPLVRISHQAGQIFIEVNDYTKPIYYITLRRRRPFVSIFRFPWEEERDLPDYGPIAEFVQIKSEGFKLWE
jgi:hypothetical protein